MTAPRLEARAVTVGRRIQASAAFSAGTLTAVIGENGAGKSTLLDCLCGVLIPAEGTVYLDGVDVARLSPQQRAAQIASAGAGSVHDEGLTLLERLVQGLTAERGARMHIDDAACARAEVVAAELDLLDHLPRHMECLSLGERRRAHVARALMLHAPSALVVDEPHTGVDVARQQQVTTALRRRAQGGAAVVFSVHDVAVALDADIVLGLRAGRIVRSGPPAEVLTERGLADIFGISGIQVVDGPNGRGVLLPRLGRE